MACEKCEKCFHFRLCEYDDKYIHSVECLNEDGCDFFLDKERVFISPCKVGDKLHTLVTMEGTAMDPFVSAFTETVERIGFATRNVMGGWKVYESEDFGKTVFLEKEKALEAKEKYVKERKTNG